MEIHVTGLYGAVLRTNVITTTLIQVNETTAPIAKGWTLAGIQRAFTTSGGVLITEGDGSAVHFTSAGGGLFTSPAGEFSSLVSGTPSGGSGFTRRFPDSTKVVFNSAGRMIEVRDRFTNITTIIYDASNRVSQVKDPLNLAVTLTYNSNGLATITDPGGRVTTVTVNASKRLTSIRDPDLVSTTLSYDGTDRLTGITNRRGHTTTFGYDAQSGKLATVTAPAISFVGTNWADSTGSPVTTLAPWQKLGVPYGSTGTPVAAPAADTIYGRVTDAGGHVTRFTVNRWGTPQQITNPLAFVTRLTFDANGLPIKTVYRVGLPDSLADSVAYNANGLPTYMRAAGRDSAIYIRYAAWAQADSIWGYQQPPVRHFIGANGRVDWTRTWSASGASVDSFTYETRGRLERVKDGEGHLAVRSWYLGTNGNRSRDSIPGGRQTTYSYDSYGRATSVTAPGVSSRFTAYDVLNRVLKDSIAGSVPTIFAYDSLFLKSVTDPKGQIYRFTYNAVGWTTAENDPANHADTLRYSREGLVRRVKNRRGQTVDYVYDAGHRVTGKSGTNTDATSWGYSADGRIVRATSPWAVDSQFFSAAGRLDSVRTKLASQTFTQRFRYTTGGALDSVAITGGGVTFLTRKYRWRTLSGTLDTIQLGGGGYTSLIWNKDQQLTSTVLPGADMISRVYTSVHAEAQISTGAPYAGTVSRYLNFDAAGASSGRSAGAG
jgi:YD repeat-containing protein